MEAKAKVQFVRISPRKVKIVLDLIRNKPVGEAAAILKHTPKAASEYVYKLVRSAAPMLKTTSAWIPKSSIFPNAMFVPDLRLSV